MVSPWLQEVISGVVGEEVEGEKAGRVGKVLNLSGDLGALDLKIAATLKMGMMVTAALPMGRGVTAALTMIVGVKLETARQDRAGLAAAVPAAMRVGMRLY